MRDKTICFRTNEKLRKALKKLSVMDRRTLSSVVENILHDYISQREPKAVAEEKRRYPRIKISAPALVSGLGGAVHTGVVNDISLGGINFSLPTSFPRDMRLNSKISLVFTLRTNEKPLTIQCSLRYIRSDDRKTIGASLIDTDFHSYRVLQDYLTEKTSTGEAEKDAALPVYQGTTEDRSPGSNPGAPGKPFHEDDRSPGRNDRPSSPPPSRQGQCPTDRKPVA
jgi:hypothetical protein